MFQKSYIGRQVFIFFNVGRANVAITRKSELLPSSESIYRNDCEKPEIRSTLIIPSYALKNAFAT